MEEAISKINKSIGVTIRYILGILVVLSVSLKIEWYETVERDAGIVECFKEAYGNVQNVIWCIMFVALLFWMHKLFGSNDVLSTICKNKRVSIVSAVLAFLFASFEVVGNSLQKVGSFYILYGRKQYALMSILKFIGLFILFWLCLYTLYTFFLNRKTDMEETGGCRVLLKKKYVMLFLIICWLPYILIFYPCSTAGDTFDQIRQFFNKPVHEGLSFQWSTYYDMVKLISNDMLINQHHPVIHTFFIGICVYLGHILGNDNFGLFLYVVCQTIFTSFILSYILVDSSKLYIKEKYRKTLLLLYSFAPIFPVWIVTICKDSLHAPIFFLYVYILIKTSYNVNLCKSKSKEFLLITIVQLLLVLTKSTGMYVLILANFCFLIKRIKKRKVFLISVIIVCVVQSVILQGIVYPFFKISPGGGQEIWSVPCNQIGRYVKEYGDTIVREDGEIIDKVIYYEYCAEWYHEDNADHIKNSFRIDATTQEKIDFMRVWWKYFWKHPEVYIVACADLCYQYFYPQNEIMNPDNAMSVSYVVSEIEGFDFYNTGIFVKFLPGIVNIVNNLIRLPILGMLVSSGFYMWLLFILFGFRFLKNRKGSIIPYIPILIYILILIAGPRYLTRYALILFYTIPFLIATELSIIVPTDE